MTDVTSKQSERQRKYRLRMNRNDDGWWWELLASNGTPMANGAALHSSKRNAIENAQRVGAVLCSDFCVVEVDGVPEKDAAPAAA